MALLWHSGRSPSLASATPSNRAVSTPSRVLAAARSHLSVATAPAAVGSAGNCPPKPRMTGSKAEPACTTDWPAQLSRGVEPTLRRAFSFALEKKKEIGILHLVPQQPHGKETMDYLIPCLAGLSSLFFLVRTVMENRALTEYWDAEEELYQWRKSHPGFHPGDYPVGRALVERAIAASKTYLHHYRSRTAEESHARLLSLLTTTRPQ